MVVSGQRSGGGFTGDPASLARDNILILCLQKRNIGAEALPVKNLHSHLTVIPGVLSFFHLHIHVEGISQQAQGSFL